VASAVLLFATELATLSYRTIGIGGCGSREDPGICTTTGGDAHGNALWLLALVVLVLALGAAIGRSRPAALGVIACGLIALGVALLLDLPDLDDTRGLETNYTDVHAHTGTAFWLMLAGAGLAVAAGLVALRAARGARPAPSPGPQEPGPEPGSREARAAAREEARRRRSGS
jgi:hypothetical protein